jgi:hypothetical protein
MEFLNMSDIEIESQFDLQLFHYAQVQKTALQYACPKKAYTPAVFEPTITCS